MAEDKFVVFILTHGRPNNVITYRTLKRGGYTGDIYIIVDNEDKAINEYKKNFGDKVIVFDKAEIAKTVDCGDNFNDRRTVLYARNACFDIARELGIEYFVQLDDDYTNIHYRFDCELVSVTGIEVGSLDSLFAVILEFYKSIPAVTIAMGQGGDMLGGKDGGYSKDLRLRRKAMNTFFCSVNRQFDFIGTLNDDVNTFVSQGNRGRLFLTFFNAAIIQMQTQYNPGGLTDIYLDRGTYVKTFYTIMYAPSCVKIAEMGHTRQRLHHRISWDNAVPKIIDERYCRRLTPERVQDEA